MKKILFVLTNHEKLGNTGKKTGFYLSEASHPAEKVLSAKYEIDFVSPLGGNAPIDGFDLSDNLNSVFMEKYKTQISATLSPSQVKAEDYKAILYVGGHGGMWDFAENTELAQISQKIYENSGVVAALCHGVAGLLNIKMSNGEPLIKDKKLTGFSNEEEQIVGLTEVVPFSLEDQLKAKGAKYSCVKAFSEYVVADGRLLTGQNPSSAALLGQKIIEALNS